MNNNLKPKMKGAITELQCATYLMNLGYPVSTPIGDLCQYDLIVDINHKLYKIQCKTGKSDDDTITIECTTNINTRTRLETMSYSKDDVDFFATYDDGTCYLIPFQENKRSFHLRKTQTKNNQTTAIHWASDYEASKIIELMK